MSLGSVLGNSPGFNLNSMLKGKTAEVIDMSAGNEPIDEIGQPLLITARKLAQLLEVSTRTLWRLRNAGQIPEPIRLGGGAVAARRGAKMDRRGLSKVHRSRKITPWRRKNGFDVQT